MFCEKESESSSPKDFVWKQFVELGLSERHFNSLQSTYRTMASTWLLATFAGIGFIVGKNLDLPFDKNVTIACLSGAGAFGITLLWAIDLRVYQILLEAGYRAGVQLEEDHPYLPQVRTGMFRLSPGQQVRKTCARFYIGGILLLLTICATALAVYVGDRPLWLAVTIAAFILLIRNVLCYIWRLSLRRDWRNRTVNGEKIYHDRKMCEVFEALRRKHSADVPFEHEDAPHSLTVQVTGEANYWRAYHLSETEDCKGTRVVADEVKGSRAVRVSWEVADPFCWPYRWIYKLRQKKRDLKAEMDHLEFTTVDQ